MCVYMETHTHILWQNESDFNKPGMPGLKFYTHTHTHMHSHTHANVHTRTHTLLTPSFQVVSMRLHV